MIQDTIAKKYAKALLELGQEDGQEERYGRDIADLESFLTKDESLWSWLTGPVGDYKGKRDTLDKILSQTNAPQIIQNFFRLLLEKDRFVLIPVIVRSYQRLLDEVLGRVRAHIITASDLTKKDVSDLSERLSTAVGKEVVCDITVDPSIIGGIIAHVGGLVFDGSIKTELHTIRDNLKKGQMV
ncbi:MAG: ATP synthase F1 subunit delta [Deltaproteobacteria bacterium]|nr:ATP synthase F1 subunit delta [Candidatus Zymogenaceae bacterium]